MSTVYRDYEYVLQVTEKLVETKESISPSEVQKCHNFKNLGKNISLSFALSGTHATLFWATQFESEKFSYEK